MTLERSVAQHYAHGALERVIFDALAAAGKDPDRLRPEDLAPVDEFHIGGRQATVEFAAQLGLAAGSEVLDIGCGLGGASRHYALEYGCRVRGIDLTEEYVRVAARLAGAVGLAGRVSYRAGSASALPFEAGCFDAATMLHVGMNIADKAQAFAEVRRVLRPGGSFGIFDVMRAGGAGAPCFPLPWAAGPETSFLEDAATYRRLLEGAGFVVRHERGRREFALEFFRRIRAKAAAALGSPGLGIHVLMGPTAEQKFANLVEALERGVVAPTEMVAQVG